jgi:hypothetical protein
MSRADVEGCEAFVDESDLTGRAAECQCHRDIDKDTG